jgi:L-aminopeptidase/D-esterase-like protein
MQYLESKNVGFRAGRVCVPIVPAAVIFDLAIGSAKARPNAGMAKRACRNASPKIVEGSVGAGTGATVGKLFGIGQATKGGVGFASMPLAGDVSVQALAVVNAFGDVIDPRTGEVIAGARAAANSNLFVRTAEQMYRGKTRTSFGATNTTLGVVMTNAALTPIEATKVAQMAQDGLARAINPVHTQFDGDLVFALSLGRRKADLNTLGVAAADALAKAIVRAVTTARGLGGVPSLRELKTENR